MCSCGTKTPVAPAVGAPLGGPAACGGPHSSSVVLIDEIGLPMAGITVDVTIGATTSPMTTDGSGTLCFTSPPGTSVTIKTGDAQEAKAGDSTSTPSGHHFKADGTGP
jgi:hypothetical protein